MAAWMTMAKASGSLTSNVRIRATPDRGMMSIAISEANTQVEDNKETDKV